MTPMPRARSSNGSALGDPTSSRVFHFQGEPLPIDGPYAESKEHLAGFFLIDVESQERAEESAAAFSCPGDAIELPPDDATGLRVLTPVPTEIEDAWRREAPHVRRMCTMRE